MKDDERTMYVNATSDDDKESTVYIGRGTSENNETQQKEESESTVYIRNKNDDESTLYIGKDGEKGNSTDESIVKEKEEELDTQDSSSSSALDNVLMAEIATEKTIAETEEADRSLNKQDIESENVQYYLPANTMLQKRYRINTVLGEGGFGITYSGWDITLNIPVAIKEYYPSGLVTRNATLGKTTQVVPVASAKYGTQFRDGIDRVLDEARRMAKFRNTPGIVGIYDFFEANNTAYIVMEYIEGVTLDVYCKENRMDNTTLFNMLVPVMDALQALHNEGIIHRDISPDNIMVDKDGNFKLLDFGAARGYSEESSTTMSVILKKSYAPEEQFRTKGNQGPWTDVYALGATIYELITGQTPPTSIDRLVEDDIVDIKEIAPSLTRPQAETIMMALAVHHKNRWQSMAEFKNSLINGVKNNISHSNNTDHEILAVNKPQGKRDNKKIIMVSLLIALGIVIIVAIVLLLTNNNGKLEGDNQRIEEKAQEKDLSVLSEDTELAVDISGETTISDMNSSDVSESKIKTDVDDVNIDNLILGTWSLNDAPDQVIRVEYDENGVLIGYLVSVTETSHYPLGAVYFRDFQLQDDGSYDYEATSWSQSLTGGSLKYNAYYGNASISKDGKKLTCYSNDYGYIYYTRCDDSFDDVEKVTLMLENKKTETKSQDDKNDNSSDDIDVSFPTEYKIKSITFKIVDAYVTKQSDNKWTAYAVAEVVSIDKDKEIYVKLPMYAYDANNRVVCNSEMETENDTITKDDVGKTYVFSDDLQISTSWDRDTMHSIKKICVGDAK